MKNLIQALLLAALCAMLPYAVHAAGTVPTDGEISAAQGEPPLIPHAVKGGDDGKACLACHEKGKKGAPMTSHPERLVCTACHVKGEVKEKLRKKK